MITPIKQLAIDSALYREQRDELAEALLTLDERLRKCSELPITASEAYDSFYQEMVSTALKKAGYD